MVVRWADACLRDEVEVGDAGEVQQGLGGAGEEGEGGQGGDGGGELEGGVGGHGEDVRVVEDGVVGDEHHYLQIKLFLLTPRYKYC